MQLFRLAALVTAPVPNRPETKRSHVTVKNFMSVEKTYVSLKREFR